MQQGTPLKSGKKAHLPGMIKTGLLPERFKKSDKICFELFVFNKNNPGIPQISSAGDCNGLAENGGFSRSEYPGSLYAEI